MTDNNILYIGPPGTGKTYSAIHEAEEYAKDKKCREIIYFHPGYSYQDFIKGIDVSANKSGNIVYASADKVFLELCKKANDEQNKKKQFAIVLDDIQRADFSGIFGELMYAIEYRGQKIKLSEGNASIIVPENLKIIATMSTAGGKGQIDYALLRRFKVHYMYSSEEMLEEALKNKLEEALKNKKVSDKNTQEIIEIYKDINKFISDHKLISDDKLKEYALGYTYFLPESDKCVVTNVKQKVLHQIIPMLEQYRKDGIIGFKNDEKDQLLTKYTQTYVTDYNEVDRDLSIEWRTSENKNWGEALTKNDGKVCINEKTDYSGVYGFTRLYLEDFITERIEANLGKGKIPKHIAYKCSDIEFENKYLYSYPQLINTIVFFLMDLKLIDYSSFYEFMIECQSKQEGTPLFSEDSNKKICHSYFKVNNKKILCEITGGDYSYSFTIRYDFKYKNTTGTPCYIDIILLLKSFHNRIMDILKTSESFIDDNTKDYYTKVNNAFIEFEKKNSADEKTKKMNKNPKIFINDLLSLCETLNDLRNQYPTKGIYKVMDTNNYFNIMNSLNIHQMILQGPPGTSKTFGAKKFIAERILTRKGTEKEEIEKILKDKKIDDILKEHQLKYNGKDIGEKVYWDIVQFHPSYAYEDFVRGIEVSTEGGNIKYKTVNKILGEIAKKAAEAEKAAEEAAKEAAKHAEAAKQNEEKAPEYYLIIDEINRANMATVFGELIYALEYRDQPVSTPYTVEGITSIKIPSNLYIIGTMNTADKSIGGMDYAIRRRFLFFPTLPDQKVVEKNAEAYFKDSNNNSDAAQDTPPEAADALNVKMFKAVEKIFENYLESDYHKDDVQIGHTYFLADINQKENESEGQQNSNDEQKTPKEKLEDLMFNRLKYQILPILREYYKDGILSPINSTFNINEEIKNGLTSDNIYYFAVNYNEFDEDKFKGMVENPVEKSNNATQEVKSRL